MPHLRIICKLLIIIILTSTVSISITACLSNTDNQNQGTCNINTSVVTFSSKIQSALLDINESVLLKHLETLLSYSPRVTGTYNCVKAAEYIHDQFVSYGLTTRYQNWSAYGNRYHPGRYNSQNIEAIKQGSDDMIILFNAHYDTVKSTPGADDNTASVAALLTIASTVSKHSFNHTIIFAAFSGEEEGLLGSHVYAKEAYLNKKKIIVELNADMIGHATTRETACSIRTPFTSDVKWVADLIIDINNLYNLPFTNIIQGVINEEGRGGSDYYSFVQYGFESVAFFEGEWNPYMHKMEDDLSNVNLSYLVNTTRLIAATIMHLADIDPPAPQVRIASPRIGYLYVNGRENIFLSDLRTMVIGDIHIWVDVLFKDTSSIIKTEFYYDNTLMYTDTSPPFNYHLTIRSLFREHKIRVVVYDDEGNTANTWMIIRYVHLFVQR